MRRWREKFIKKDRRMDGGREKEKKREAEKERMMDANESRSGKERRFSFMCAHCLNDVVQQHMRMTLGSVSVGSSDHSLCKLQVWIRMSSRRMSAFPQTARILESSER